MSDGENKLLTTLGEHVICDQIDVLEKALEYSLENTSGSHHESSLEGAIEGLKWVYGDYHSPHEDYEHFIDGYYDNE